MGDELLWAVKNGDLEQIKVLAAKVDVNNEWMNGRLAIHHAADYGQAEVIAYLVEAGAKVNVDDKHGISPLLAAVFEGHADCVKLLLQKGANKNGKAPDGQSYLDSADSDEIKALLK